MTHFINSFSQEVWENTYKYADEKTVDETLYRVANHLAKLETDPDIWAEKFYSVLKDLAFVPGGRILSNAGIGLQGTTYINCFVSGPTCKDKDSMQGIFHELAKQGLILKSEGGYGFCVDFLRPRGGFIGGIGNQTPGSVKFLELWDKQSEIITLGSGKEKIGSKEKGRIRKGAQMVTMSCWHPDIEEFVTAKQTPGRLTKFNMSVLITDDFMHAVKEHKPWNLLFPDIQSQKELYRDIWDGNINAWVSAGGQVVVYKTYKDANELWDLIMSSTYNRNEPGVLFIDTINRLNNLNYCEHINATNPCGEQVLPPGGCCLLGSINLTQFVDGDGWDYEKLAAYIPTIVRLMDNVNDLTYVPLVEQKENLIDKRRIGLGILGYASALMMMKIPYGSNKALNLANELMAFLANNAYQASALLAKEKGIFPRFDKEKYLEQPFIKQLSEKTRQMIAEFGLRNSHLLSIQPTGNTSILANCVSNGLEPIFLPVYVRTSIVQHKPEKMDLPRNIDWENKKFVSEGEWTWIREGDEDMLATIWVDGTEEVTYKYDRSRGLVKETQVMDYGVNWLMENKEWDENAKYAKACAMGIDIKDHINTLLIFARWVDSAISKTVNIPTEFSFEQFKNVYIKAFDTGFIKGCTTYRVGTMASVLAEKSALATAQPGRILKRPKTLDCDIINLTYKQKPWIAFVGLLDNKPYEVFAMKARKLKLSPKIKHGRLTKTSPGKYDLELDDGTILEDICEHFEKDEEEAVTRLISTALRYGVETEAIIDQLLKSQGTIMSFSRVIARTLKRYLTGKLSILKCSKCKSRNMQMVDGCPKCNDCGMSKCD